MILPPRVVRKEERRLLHRLETSSRRRPIPSKTLRPRRNQILSYNVVKKVIHGEDIFKQPSTTPIAEDEKAESDRNALLSKRPSKLRRSNWVSI